MLVAAALLAGAQAPQTRGATDGAAAAREWERRAQQDARVRAERRARMAQSRAHARMPDTMYASTPDPSAAPHPFPLDVGLKSTSERAGLPRGMPSRSAMRLTHRIGLFPSAADTRRRQGFARIINRSDSDGEVSIVARDDAGTEYGPLTLAIGAGEAKHFNSEDLETGNAGKGLEGATGPLDKGAWRLELSSPLDLQVLSYIRTSDGFLTSMHDLVARTEAGQHRVAIFNPGRNANQVSWLRVINPGAERTEVRIEGIDDAGRSPGEAVVFTLGGGASRTLDAKALESGSGDGVSGGLGTGKGKWRLVVSSDEPIEVLNTLSTPTGHLTNLSTAPGNTGSDDGATHRIGLFPSAADARRRQGFARIINRSDSEGEVSIVARDDAGTEYGPLTLAIGAGETKHFNSEDLETGNAGKGLDGATGPLDKGAWRLELSSTLDLQVLSYIRTSDGFLTSMHDLVARTEAGQHRVAIFNPGRNTNQVSRLRVVNPGAERTEVRIEGIDDAGRSPGEAVVFMLDAGASRTLDARELESGEGLSGGLGTGKGKWRLVVSSDEPIEVLNMLSTPTGHLTNLSTVPGPAVSAESAADVFAERISEPIVQDKCIACHVEGGVSGNTRLVFVRDTEPDHEARNLQTFKTFLDEVDDGARFILNKIQGVAHGGGVQVAAGTSEFADMERFLGLLGEDVKPVPITPQTLFDTVTMAPARKTLRRAAIIFAGRIPTDAEYAAAERGTEALRATIRSLMTGPEFHEFLIRGANDRLLTNRGGHIIDSNAGYYVDFTNEAWRRRAAAQASGDDRDFTRYYLWNDRTQHGFRRAPLELIAHVVENDRPYTEILTADYVMANPWSAAAYGASTRFDDPGDVHEFRPSEIVSYYRHGEGYESEYDSTVQHARVFDPGPLITDYPHAGILNTAAFLFRYPTTATNRNRARSRWTYYHFLDLDVEKSASRTTDPDALADTNNPTMFNPACTVCHRVLDPVAGAFQNYGDEGNYRDKWGGLDSLDDFYKHPEDDVFDIEADSWAERQTFSIKVWLARDSSLLLRHVNNNYCNENECGTLGRDFRLDEIAVRDAESGTLVRRIEWEVLDEHCLHDGKYNRGSGEDDHYQWWGWDCEIPLVLPADDTYVIEVVAWADRAGDELAKLAISAVLYREGDTWYRDMRTPGFAGEQAPSSDNSVQWLAKRIVVDERFAEATVAFWWPAIMGSEFAEPPEDETDADFEGRLLAANAQASEVQRLARGFRSGFHGGSAYNLKDLLVEIVLSKWFRAGAVTDSDPVRQVALRDAGARRLLTPEELSRKTGALTGFEWGRIIGFGCWPECDRRPSTLTQEYRLLYGGIDSDGITQRARDVTSVMAGVAKRHAVVVSCPVVMRELYLLPDTERRLFAGIDPSVTPSGGADRIRSKLVELYEKLLGVQVTPHSPDVEAAYRLFAGVVEDGPKSQDDWFATYGWFAHWECDWWSDKFFLDGVLDDAIVEHENEDGWRWYDFDWDRVQPFIDDIDWSDPHHAARAWVVALAYILMDYRYLNL